MYEEEMIKLVQSARFIMNDVDHLEIQAKGRANFVTQIDVAVQEYLRQGLYELNPFVHLLAEEQNNETIDPGKAYWILDPIDGTQNFIRHMGLSAIGLAYYANGQLQDGVVYNPTTDECFHASRGKGSYLNDKRLQVTANEALADSLVLIGTSPYDRQFTDTNFPLWKEMFSRSLDIRRTGSACLDLAYVAAGRCDVYFERNLKPWDMAAGILLVEESGGIVTDYKGGVVDFLHNSDVCAGNKAVHKETLGLIRQYIG